MYPQTGRTGCLTTPHHPVVRGNGNGCPHLCKEISFPISMYQTLTLYPYFILESANYPGCMIVMGYF